MPKIVAKNLTKIYYGGYTAFSDVSFELENELLLVFGGFKSGKTSLLKCIGGAENFTSGKLMLDNIDIALIEPKERIIGLTYGIESMKKNKTVLYNIVYPLRLRNFNNEQIKYAIDKLLNKIDISAILELPVHTLSHFELALLILARLFVLDRNVYMIDNGVFNLDVYEKEKLISIIEKISKEIEKPVIFATEDKQDLHRFGTKILMLINGKAYQSDSYNNVYNLPNTLAIAREISSHLNIIDASIVKEKEIILTLLNKKIIIKNKSLANFSKVKVVIYPEDIELTKIGKENSIEKLIEMNGKKTNKINEINRIKSDTESNNKNEISNQLKISQTFVNNINQNANGLSITDMHCENRYKVINVYDYGFYKIYSLKNNDDIIKVLSNDIIQISEFVNITINKITLFDCYSEFRVSEQIKIN